MTRSLYNFSSDVTVEDARKVLLSYLDDVSWCLWKMDNVRICTGLVTQKEYCIIMFYQMWVYLYLQASKSFFLLSRLVSLILLVTTIIKMLMMRIMRTLISNNGKNNCINNDNSNHHINHTKCITKNHYYYHGYHRYNK